MQLGPMEIALIIVVIVLLFGAKKIPELARSLGRASQEYKKAKEDFLAEVNKPVEDIKDAMESDKPVSANVSSKDSKESGSMNS
ncbi:MAG: twin-arginine translocase TatA/TatE family subunit [Lentisphaeria bacterium]|nr:twin-arginine translocase TatA/TatE family subunit [Lentisphaeria bacterium]